MNTINKLSLIFLSLVFSQAPLLSQSTNAPMMAMTPQDIANEQGLMAGMWSYLDNSGVIDFIKNQKAKTAAAVIVGTLAGFLWFAAKKMARVPTATTIGAAAPSVAQTFAETIVSPGTVDAASSMTREVIQQVAQLPTEAVQEAVNPLLTGIQNAAANLQHVQTVVKQGAQAIPFGARWALGGGSPT